MTEVENNVTLNGYHGGFESNIPSDQLQKCSENETDIPAFEIDSIELATPELFSNDAGDDLQNQDISYTEEPKIFENSMPEKEEEIKEPEMFEESNSEEDFEIPAFLRKQKN